MMKNSFESNASFKILHWISVCFPDSVVPAVQVCAQSCLTLCDPVDCTPSGSSVYGILQARVLEWIAVPFSRGSSWPKDPTHVSYTVDSLPIEPLTLIIWGLIVYFQKKYTWDNEFSVYLHEGCMSYHKSLQWSVLPALIYNINLSTLLLRGE